MVSRTHLYVLTQARRGDAAAQLELGRLYLTGASGLPRNHAVALDWLLRAWRQGLAEAGALLTRSVPIETTLGSSRLEELITLYRQQAAAGDDTARWAYIRLLDEQPTVTLREYPQAVTLAHDFLASLAAAGNAAAQWRLSRDLDERGQHGPARHWAASAAQAGSADARGWLAEQINAVDDPAAFSAMAGPVVESLLSQAAPITSDRLPLLFGYYRSRGWTEALARDALTVAAESGLADAQYELGRLQLDLQQLDERNKVHAQDQKALARLLASDPDQERPAPSLRSAVRWLTRAAAQEHRDAAYLLGIVFRVPAYSKRNLVDSDMYFERAAQLGQVDAQYWLGAHLWRNRARGDDADALAVHWLIRAARAGHDAAGQLLNAISGTAADAGDSPFDRLSDSWIENLGARHPLMAARIAVAKAFRLKRIEALLLDLPRADRDEFLVIDVSAWTPKHTRRIVRISSDAQRHVLNEAVRRFRDLDCGPDGPEGAYRQRLYLLRKLLDEAAREMAHEASVRRTTAKPLFRPATGYRGNAGLALVG